MTALMSWTRSESLKGLKKCGLPNIQSAAHGHKGEAMVEAYGVGEARRRGEKISS